MSLTVGTTAPDFTLSTKNANGIQKISLKESLANGKVVLLFFPLAFTGVCTDEMCSVSGGIEDYKALNASVYAISVDSMFAQEAWVNANKITIPVLSDFNKEVSKAYGVLAEEFLPEKLGLKGVSNRSAFVINTDGTIAFAWSSENPGNLPPFDEMKQALA